MRNNQSGLHTAGTVEEVDIAFDLNHEILDVLGGVLVISGTVPASLVCIPVLPDRTLYFTADKVEGNAVCRGDAAFGSFKRVFHEIIPCVVQIEPTGGELAEHCIILLSIFLDHAGVGRLACADTGFAEVVVNTVYLADAGIQNAVVVVGIVDPAVCQHNAVDIGLAVGVNAVEQLAAGTLENAVCKVVAVAGCLDIRTPDNNGITVCAVGSAAVAVLGTGGFKVLQCCCAVDMTAVPCRIISLALCGGIHLCEVAPHFGVAEDAVTGEGGGGAVGAGENTCVNLCDDRHSPEFLAVSEVLQRHGILACLGTVCIGIAGLQRPYADGKLCEYRLAGLCVFTGAADDDLGDVFGRIDCVECGKAFRRHHVIKLPGAVVVKVHSQGDGVDLFHCGGEDMHVVNGTELDAVKRCIRRCEPYGAVGCGCCDRDGLVCVSVVADVVACRELDGMLAVGQGDVFNGNLAVCIGGSAFDAVDVRLDGGCIDAGCVALCIIGNGGTEGHGIGAHGMTVQRCRVGHAVNGVSDAGNDGCFTVIDCGGVVNGEVVKIEAELAGDVALLCRIIIVCGAVAVGDVELHHGTVCREADGLICGGIDMQIVPAGFVKGINDTGTAGGGIHIVAVDAAAEDRRTVGIKGNGSQRPASPQTDAFVGNVDPDTDTDCVFEDLGFCCIERGLHVAGFERVAVVDIRCKRVGTAVNLTVFCGDDLLGYLGPYIVVFGAGGFVDDDVLVGAVLKVKEDLGALAERDGGGRGDVRMIDELCGQGCGGCRGVCGCDEIQAVNRTDIGGQGKDKVSCRDSDLLDAVGCAQVQRNALTERNGHFAAAEGNRIGNDDADNGFADDTAVNGHLDDRITGLAGRNEQTVLNGTGFRIGQLPCGICGDFRGAARTVNTECADGNGGVRRDVIVLGGEGCALEHAVGNCGGNDDEAVGDRTLRAVGGAVDDLEFGFTLCLCGEGTGTAAVEVTCPDTAEVEHDLRLFHNGQTDGLRCLVAVCGHQDDLAVGGDTDGLTGILLFCVEAGADRTVLNQHGIDADGLLNVALIGGIAVLAADLDGAVLHHSEIAVVIAFGLCGDVDAVHDERTGGLTGDHVVGGGVDTCHNRTLIVRIIGGCLLVEGGNLFCELGHAVLCRIHVLVGCKQSDRINTRVCRGDEHLDLIAVLVVQRIGIKRDTGSQC